MCTCRKIDESKIKQCVNDGYTTLYEIYHKLKISNLCGKCTRNFEILFRDIQLKPQE